jgi:hypothetical protein
MEHIKSPVSILLYCPIYEMVFKTLRAGAAIYTAVVVAPSTGPIRPNCEFRVLLRRFAATRWKRAKTLPRTLARTDLAASPWQRPVSHFTQQFLAVIPHPPQSPDLAPCDFLLFPKMKLKLKERGLIPLRRSKPNRREWQKRTSRKRSKNGGDGGTAVYMREGTTSRMMAADRPYGDCYDFYSVRPEYLNTTISYLSTALHIVGRPSIRILSMNHAVVTGTHLSWPCGCKMSNYFMAEYRKNWVPLFRFWSVYSLYTSCSGICMASHSCIDIIYNLVNGCHVIRYLLVK